MLGSAVPLARRLAKAGRTRPSEPEAVTALSDLVPIARHGFCRKRVHGQLYSVHFCITMCRESAGENLNDLEENMRPVPGNDLVLGGIVNREETLALPRELRAQHLYVCGATGTGKSKLLEYLLRQDIKSWRKS